MTNTRKFLFVDLDETLLTSDKRIDGRDLEAINEMLDKGHCFAFVTGRPYPDAISVAERYRIVRDGFYIASYNGAQINNPVTGDLLYASPVSKDDVRLIFDLAKEQGVHCQTYNRNYVIATEGKDIVDIYLKGKVMEPLMVDTIDDVITSLTGPTMKVVCMEIDDRPKLQRFRDHITPLLPPHLNTFFSSDRILEISAADSSKGTGLRRLCEICNIPVADSIGAGDEENDLPLLEAAGLGVAMANARDNVKTAADAVTEHDNNHGGIAEIIYKYILD
ncbi:hypothetical protein SAMN06296386_11617 [Lachnospiraceae bacterium]|nr:hypothetical protein SAMN06296386_11617 [Lachnospiraceae bacterium]